MAREQLRHGQRAAVAGAMQFGEIAFGQAIAGRRIERRPAGEQASAGLRDRGEAAFGEQFAELDDFRILRHCKGW